MARKTIFVSDMDDTPIEDEKQAAKLVITFGDHRKGRYEADLTADQAHALAKDTKARAVKARGRRPAAATA